MPQAKGNKKIPMRPIFLKKRICLLQLLPELVKVVFI